MLFISFLCLFMHKNFNYGMISLETIRFIHIRCIIMFHHNSLCSKLQIIAIAQKLYCCMSVRAANIAHKFYSLTFNPLQNWSPDSLFTYQFLVPKKGYTVQQQMVVTTFMLFFEALQLCVKRTWFRFLNHFWAGYENIKKPSLYKILLEHLLKVPYL